MVQTKMAMRRVLVVSIVGLLTLASCSEPEANQPGTLALQDETVPASPVLIISNDFDDEQRRQVIQTMPTPNDLFQLMGSIGTGVDRKSFFDVKLAKEQTDELTCAYRFGICATDLVYASYTGMNAEVVRYYLTIKKMGDELGISDSFDRIDVRRLESNLTNGDSLSVLTNEAYLMAYEKLDQEERGDLLAAVLIGGWVESTYLLAERIVDYDKENPLLSRLVEQKFGLAQLIDLSEINSGSPEIVQLRTELLVIQDIFDRVSSTRTRSASSSRSGKMILGDSESFDLDSGKFEEIKAAVRTLRKAIFGEKGLTNT